MNQAKQQTPHPLWRTTILAFLLVAAVLMAACGRDEAPPPSEPAPAPTTAPPDAAPTASPTPLPATEAATSAPALPAQIAVTATAALTGATEVTATQPVTASAAPQDTAVVCSMPPNADFSGYGDLERRMGCALADASFEPVGIQEFGAAPDYDRFMLWFGDENQIYVLFPDKTWLAYSDTWEDGEPEIFCNPTDGPSASPPLPRRGFGKLWCTVESVQEQMGLSDREERLCQHAVTQRFDQGRLLACFEDATIRYYRLLNDGAWDMESVQ